MNLAESESRPVLGPTGNKARSVELLKPLSKLKNYKLEKPLQNGEIKAQVSPALPLYTSPPSQPKPNCKRVPSLLRKQQEHKLLKKNLSMNASCSSDASTDSSHSRASTGRISRRSTPIRRKHSASKVEKVVTDNFIVDANASEDASLVKSRCSWITPTTDPCYAAFHDEEWGVPIHDDKKLFEFLSLSTALAELTWPAILNKRHMFREVFQDFDPVSVSKLNEKKIATPGSSASSLLSEQKLRGIIENARQMCKIINEFGSFHKYIWGFVNHKPTVGHFHYSRQVPIKTSKADMISKDLVRRGLRGVGPTVVYSFMQVAGLTNDHLISCFRFPECIAAADSKDDNFNARAEGKHPEEANDLGLDVALDDLNISAGEPSAANWEDIN